MNDNAGISKHFIKPYKSSFILSDECLPTFFWFCKLFERGKIFTFSYKLLNKKKFQKNLSVERKF